MLARKDYSTYDSGGFYKSIIRLQKNSEDVNLHSQRIFDLKRVLLFITWSHILFTAKFSSYKFSTVYKESWLQN